MVIKPAMIVCAKLRIRFHVQRSDPSKSALFEQHGGLSRSRTVGTDEDDRFVAVPDGASVLELRKGNQLGPLDVSERSTELDVLANVEHGWTLAERRSMRLPE